MASLSIGLPANRTDRRLSINRDARILSMLCGKPSRCRYLAVILLLLRQQIRRYLAPHSKPPTRMHDSSQKFFLGIKNDSVFLPDSLLLYHFRHFFQGVFTHFCSSQIGQATPYLYLGIYYC